MDCPCVLRPIAKTPSPASVFKNRAKYNLARNTYLASRLLLLGDDLIFDAGVDGGGNDVRGADITDPFQGAQLCLGCGIDIEELRGGKALRWLRLVGLGYRRRAGFARNSGLNRLR